MRPKPRFVVALIAVIVLVLLATDRSHPSSASAPRVSPVPPATAAPAEGTSATAIQPVAGVAPGTAAPGLPRFDPTREWPLAYLQASALWTATEGANVKVAVVDTGVDAGQPDLAGAVIEAIDLTRGPVGDQSGDSHGTAVAGLIAGRGSADDPRHVAGLAPRAELIDVRVTNQPDAVTAAEIADGITVAVEAGAQVINVSLGVAKDDKQLDRAAKFALDHGRLVVASAGAGSALQYPAASPGMLAVAATNKDHAPMGSLADYGPMTVYAPGEDLYSTAERVPGGGHDGYIGGISGNDYATAYVSAAAALVLSADPGLGAGDLKHLIVRLASPVPGVAGPGTLDPFAVVSYASELLGPRPSDTAGPNPSAGTRATAPASSRANPATADHGFGLRAIGTAVGVGVVALLLLLIVVMVLTSGGGPRPPRGRRVEHTSSTWEAW